MATAAGSHVWLLWKQGWYSYLSYPSLPSHFPFLPHHLNTPSSFFTSLRTQERPMGGPGHHGGSKLGLGPWPPGSLGLREHILSHSGMWLFWYKVWGICILELSLGKDLSQSCL